MAHPGVGLRHVRGLEEVDDDLDRQGSVVATFYQWMKTEYGFKDEQVKPYTFNPGPFIANKQAVQQGYVTSEPLRDREAGRLQAEGVPAGRQRLRHLCDDRSRRGARWSRSKPDMVQRFVDASSIGWYNYLYGDNNKAQRR